MDNCDKAYSRPCLLEQHIRSHKDERPFLCNVPGCNKAFLRDSHLKTHILSHSVEKPLYCSFCGKGFNTNQHLNRHERTHVPSVRCTFQGCGLAFKRSSQLRKHISEFHTFSKEHTCPYCPRKFDLSSRLETHIKKTHAKMPSYHCGNDGCLETFTSWQELQSHTKISHKTITCYCGEKLPSEVAFAEHIKTIHPNLSNGLIDSITQQQSVYQDQFTHEWVCQESQCGSSSAAFRDKTSLIYHYQQFHEFVPESLQVQVLTPGSSVEGLPPLSGTNGQTQSPNHPYFNFQSQGQSQLPKHTYPLTSSSTLIERLTSVGYDRNRRIMCPIPDCCYRFAREYDLRRHVKAKHPHIITESGRLMVDYISIPPLPSQSDVQFSGNTQSTVAFQSQNCMKMESVDAKTESLNDSRLNNQESLPSLPNFSSSLQNTSIDPNVSNEHVSPSHSPSLSQQHSTQAPLTSNSNSNVNMNCLSQNHGSLDAFFSSDMLNSGSNISNLHIHLPNDLLNEPSNHYANMNRSGTQSFNYPTNPKSGKSNINNFSSISHAQNPQVGLRTMNTINSPGPSSTNSQAPSMHLSRSNTPIYSSQGHLYSLNNIPSSISTPTVSSPHQPYVSTHNSPQQLSNIQQAQLLNPLSKTFTSHERNESLQNISTSTSQEIDPMILNGSM